MLRFAIIKEVKGIERVVLEQDVGHLISAFMGKRGMILEKLHAEKMRVWQGKKALLRGSPPKAVFTQDEIESAERVAFDYIQQAFKEKTVALV